MLTHSEVLRVVDWALHDAFITNERGNVPITTEMALRAFGATTRKADWRDGATMGAAAELYCTIWIGIREKTKKTNRAAGDTAAHWNATTPWGKNAY